MADYAVQYGVKVPLPACPNPLFLKWLTEWRAEAALKQHKSQVVYEKAIESLAMYPLPLRSGREAKILYGFGDGICNRLDERLKDYYLELGMNVPMYFIPQSLSASPGKGKTGGGKKQMDNSPAKAQGPWESADGPSDEDDVASLRPSPSRRRRPPNGETQDYKPHKQSGGYALLLTLFRGSQRPNSQGFMTKVQLQRKAQPLAKKSFTHFYASYRYNAWSSISALIEKDLVIKTGFPARFSLTEKGIKLGEKLYAEHLGQDKLDDLRAGLADSEDLSSTEDEDEEEELAAAVPPSPVKSSCGQPFPEPPVCPGASGMGGTAGAPYAENPLPPDPPIEGTSHQPPYVHVPEFTLSPGEFEVVLCIDFIETTAGASHRKRELVTELKKNGVNFDVRKLHVGDFLWVGREKLKPVSGQSQAARPRELVLDYVVERKRMDDLCGSIVDGRFREQKFRIKRSGLKNPIYLVEDCKFVKHLSLPETTLQQAIVNTQVVDGFFVKRTRDVKESAAYLTVMTRYLQSLYLRKSLVSCRKAELPACNLFAASEPDTCILLTFYEFNEGAMKNRAQSVKEVFAKQLMQISGVSGEKAVAILARYDSLASLMKAYEDCPCPVEREKLLSSIKCGSLQRNLGPALSKTLSQLYCTQGPLH